MEFTVELGDMRLDKYIRKFINNIKQSTLEIKLRDKSIKLNGKTASSDIRVNIGDVIYVHDKLIAGGIEKSEKSKVENFLKSLILYEDDDIMIINKPYGLAVQGGRRITSSIDTLIDKNYHIVHRLDQHTTGILVIAKNLKTTKVMGDKFKNKDISKKYIALTAGIPRKNNDRIISNIASQYVKGREIMVSTNSNDGKKAITDLKVIKKFPFYNVAHLELSPLTGRKHQLRVHMKDLLSPILSDGKYGGKKAFIDELDRKLSLHASYIKFNLYGKTIEVSAALPIHIEKNLRLLHLSMQ